jgi:alpha-galactosidase
MYRNPWRSPVPPFSFDYNGQSDAEAFRRWTGSFGDGSPERIQVANDAETGLSVMSHARLLDDVNGIEWVLTFENRGTTDTPQLENVQALDWHINMPDSESVRVHHANGSQCRRDDFVGQVSPLNPDGEVILKPIGGRSSNGVLPFVNIDWGNGGVMLAVGWSGQWKLSLRREANTIRITCGMESASLSLKPGESIRSPRILLLGWTGDDPDIGNNLLRRALLKHYSQMADGEPVPAPLSHMRQLVYYETGKVTEEDHLKAVERAAELGLENFWVDALWYGSGGEWWDEVGNWHVSRDRFPRGLKPISDAAHAHGMTFMVWFEPERVRRGTQIHTEHPEWLLDIPTDTDNFLLDLGNDDARRYITDLISENITESGIDIYRQDFNFEPIDYWTRADEPNRIGMHEIRHIEGLYTMWDDLRERHPGLLIDNCASGGRRIDLETTARSFPLWRSDYTDAGARHEGMGLQVGAQAQTAGLSRWVPLHAASVWTFSPYDVRSSFSTGVCPYTDILAEDYPVEQVKAAIKEIKRLRPYLLGDMYPLVPLTIEDHDWCAYQFDRPDLGMGCAIFLRRHESPYPTMQAGLRAIVEDASYEISMSRTFDQAPFNAIGTWDLQHISVTIPEAAGSLLLEYRHR